jgi:alpha-tubulin suppressor-like RCC1 family protein
MFGQLGTDISASGKTARNVPERLLPRHFGGCAALMVACGCDFTVLVNAAGQVWTCGDGRYGKLGLGDCHDRTEFFMVDKTHFDNSAVGMVSAGNEHIMALSRTQGKLFTWGCNMRGQLGNGHYCAVAVPVEVASSVVDGENFVFLDAGSNFSMAVTADGGLWVCGDGESGELGICPSRSPVAVLQCAWKAREVGHPGVRMVACGTAHTLLLTENHEVWSCGGGDSCLGTLYADTLVAPIPCWFFQRVHTAGFASNKIKLIAAGNGTSSAVDENGSMYVWGRHLHDMGVYWQPKCVVYSELATARIGRWHKPRPELALAVFMGCHRRLGGASELKHFADDLLRSIFERTSFVAAAGCADGFHVLVGRCEP